MSTLVLNERVRELEHGYKLIAFWGQYTYEIIRLEKPLSTGESLLVSSKMSFPGYSESKTLVEQVTTDKDYLLVLSERFKMGTKGYSSYELLEADTFTGSLKDPSFIEFTESFKLKEVTYGLS